MLQDFEDDEILKIIASLPDEKAAEVLARTDPGTQRIITESLDAERLARLVAALPPDEATDLLDTMSGPEHEAVLSRVPPEQASVLRQLDAYDPESAGGIMTTRFIAVRETATADDALARVRSSPDVEGFHYVYVTDDAGRLKGVVSAKGLISAPQGAAMSDVMNREVASVRVDEDRTHVAAAVRKYRIEAVPVVDLDGRLAGIVTVDDVLDAVSDEMNEEILHIGGAGGAHPTRQPLLRQVALRLPWLVVTLAGEIVVAMIMRRYGAMLQEILAVVFFLPAISAMGGNAGIQSSTIMVRGLATGEVDYARLLRVLLGEMKVGLLLGVFFGLAVGFFVHFYFQAEYYAVGLGITVGVAMIAGILASICLGTLIPIGCSRLGIDPAIIAGPFVSVLNDIASMSIYFAVATLILARSL